MEHTDTKAAWSTYAGLFLTALATLAYEIVLTRIFSVTVWYHFAFLAVSLAMFGMTAGALVVHLFPRLFTFEKINHQLCLAASMFAISVPLSFLTHASIPILMKGSFIFTAVGMFAIFFSCLALSIPFVFSGIAVCLVLTRFVGQVAKLYAADLLGAATACLFVVYELNATDGPTTLLVAAVLAALSAICFGLKIRESKQMVMALACFLVLGIATAVNVSELRTTHNPFFRIVWLKGELAPRPTYEAWNSFSAVRVVGSPQHPFPPSGWGLDPRFISGNVIGQLYEDIDGNAATFITGFRGNLAQVDYLKYDVTNVAHYLVNQGKVLVIGVGGGRDVLSALVFHQKQILGVELNNHILDALTKYFANFSGHLDKVVGVRLVNDEARSYVTRSNEKFDLIQISLIDTWAATAAGAFSLAENSLYTADAWNCFLDHLSDKGILSVSRWYTLNNPAEIYRLMSLATEALKNKGINNPREHLALVQFTPSVNGVPSEPGLGTLIVSRSALDHDQLSLLAKVTKVLNFKIALSPVSAVDPKLALIADHKLSQSELEANFPTRIDPPTDDCPYFFQLAKTFNLDDLIQWIRSPAENNLHMEGIAILSILTTVLSILLTLCIFVPLRLSSSTEQLKGSGPLCLYFLAIGMGFMFIEISQMQRLAVFLGNPTYSLSVVLFSMLTFTGLGSMLTPQLDRMPVLKSPFVRMWLICAVIVVVGLITPHLTKQFMASDTVQRIGIAIALLAPLGLAAGTAFPTGMTMAAGKSRDLTAWLWGINGAASVLSSVLTVLISINFGITVSYFMACLFYGMGAFAARSSLTRPSVAEPTT